MRYIVESVEGGVCDITNMFNGLGFEVTTPTEAESLVVRVANGFAAVDASDYEIHTVH